MSKPHSHKNLEKPQFEALFKAHFQALCRYAVQYVGDLDTAQDICQKVFITLWEKRKDINTNQSIKSYLFTAVKNRSLNYIRDHKKYRSKVLDLDNSDFDLHAQEDPYDVEDLKVKIESALSSLPEKCRLVFEMSRFRGMKYKEIAEELDIAQKTVEAHMSKALKTLKEQLKDYTLIFFIILDWLN